MTSAQGTDYGWTVGTPGLFAIEVTSPAGLDAQVVVKDEAGEVVADEVAEAAGQPVTAKVLSLKPGRFTLTVKDVAGDSGFDYALAIRAEEVADAHAAKPMLEEKQPEAKTVAAAPVVKVKAKPAKKN